MAEVSQTPASVAKTASTVMQEVNFGSAGVVAGNTVYRHTDGTYKLAQKDGTVAEAAVAGMTLNGGGVGQPGKIATGGKVNPGGTLVIGKYYGPGATPGSLQLIDEVASGQFASILGFADAADSLTLIPFAAPIAAASDIA